MGMFNEDLPTATTNWFTDITPNSSAGYMNIFVCVASAGVFSVTRTQGSTTVVLNMNSGSALTSGAEYNFKVPATYGDGISVRYSTTGAKILSFHMMEEGA
jgi:hypothetical protein